MFIVTIETKKYGQRVLCKDHGLVYWGTSKDDGKWIAKYPQREAAERMAVKLGGEARHHSAAP